MMRKTIAQQRHEKQIAHYRSLRDELGTKQWPNQNHKVSFLIAMEDSIHHNELALAKENGRIDAVRAKRKAVA